MLTLTGEDKQAVHWISPNNVLPDIAHPRRSYRGLHSSYDVMGVTHDLGGYIVLSVWLALLYWTCMVSLLFSCPSSPPYLSIISGLTHSFHCLRELYFWWKKMISNKVTKPTPQQDKRYNFMRRRYRLRVQTRLFPFSRPKENCFLSKIYYKIRFGRTSSWQLFCTNRYFIDLSIFKSSAKHEIWNMR